MNEMRFVVIVLVLIVCANLNYQSLLFQMRKLDAKSTGMTMIQFLKVNKKIIVPVNNEIGCSCGCYDSPLPDCPPLYDLKDVQESGNAKITKEIQEFMDTAQLRQKRAGEELCQRLSLMENDNVEMITGSGAYCLHALLKQENQTDRGTVTFPYSHRTIPLPRLHSQPSPEILDILYTFIQKEAVRSLTEFGAGVGSYGTMLEQKFPKTLVYRGYDGSSDVEDYTHGYIKYSDLSLPVNTPPSDWVLSLNVGANIPATLEGMVIRNLHANNCKGIIISWETPEQPGIRHVNLHNNQYVIETFAKLGYIFDLVETRRFREAVPQDSSFTKSLLVLRRSVNVC